ncbi:MAG: hypothetical protein JXB88_18595 [Spirochaetales bacterium]|nr:hypothetical protein [Spirochaetales bacterium]
MEISEECKKEMEREEIYDLSEEGIEMKKEIIFCEQQSLFVNYDRCIAGIL